MKTEKNPDAGCDRMLLAIPLITENAVACLPHHNLPIVFACHEGIQEGSGGVNNRPQKMSCVQVRSGGDPLEPYQMPIDLSPVVLHEPFRDRNGRYARLIGRRSHSDEPPERQGYSLGEI